MFCGHDALCTSPCAAFVPAHIGLPTACYSSPCQALTVARNWETTHGIEDPKLVAPLGELLKPDPPTPPPPPGWIYRRNQSKHQSNGGGGGGHISDDKDSEAALHHMGAASPARGNAASPKRAQDNAVQATCVLCRCQLPYMHRPEPPTAHC